MFLQSVSLLSDLTDEQRAALVAFAEMDTDGDGELSDGDTLVDMTDALMPVGALNFAGSAMTAAQVISANSRAIGLVPDGIGYVQFNLSEGDLVA